MKTVSSGFTIPWEDFTQAMRGEQIFHAQYCPANKDACLGAWLDRWIYCDSYVVAKQVYRKDNVTDYTERTHPITTKGPTR